MKICKSCAAQLEDNVTVCPYCRTPFENISNDFHYQQSYNQGYQQVNNQGYQPVNNQMYQQGYMNPYVQENPYKKKISDIVGAVIASIGLFYCLGIFAVISDIQKFIDESLNKETVDLINGNGALAGFSFTWVVFLPGIISLIIGLSGIKKRKVGICKYNLIAGVINILVGVVAFIKVYNYFS